MNLTLKRWLGVVTLLVIVGGVFLQFGGQAFRQQELADPPIRYGGP